MSAPSISEVARLAAEAAIAKRPMPSTEYESPFKRSQLDPAYEQFEPFDPPLEQPDVGSFDLAGTFGSAGTFGPVIKVSTNVTVPHVNDTEADVRKQLESNGVLSLILWTILHRSFNTKTGNVSAFFATMQTPDGSQHPVVVGHWSLWQRVCMHCYRCFNTRNKDLVGVNKRDMRNTFSAFIVHGLSTADICMFRRVTGADPMAKTRARCHSHFVMSAYWFRHVANILSSIYSEDDLLGSDVDRDVFCKDDEFTTDTLRNFRDLNVSTYQVVHTQQSKFSASAHFGAPDKYYDDLTPSFGVEWSKDQLKRLWDCMSFFGDGHRHMHRTSFYSVINHPIRTRREIVQSMPNGVPDDRV